MAPSKNSQKPFYHFLTNYDLIHLLGQQIVNALSFSIRSFNAFISTLSPIIFVLLKFDAICLKKQSASVNIWLNKWKYEMVFEEVKLTIPCHECLKLF